MMQFTCLCCGYKALEEGENTCKVCNWINDPYQAMDPDQAGGANAKSLRQAQFLFQKQKRKITGYVKDSKWCAFSPPLASDAASALVMRYFSNSKFA